MTALSPLITLLVKADEEMQRFDITSTDDKHLSELYEDVCKIRELSGLLWLAPFLEMCKRELFSKDDGGEAA